MDEWDLDNVWNSSYLQELNNTFLFDLSRLRPPESLDAALRIVTVLLYSVLCAVGLLGNLLVLYLARGGGGPNQPAIHVFVFSLALTDFQFVLVLPLWAAEVALDHDWPFGDGMCKLALFLTVLNMYASVFFLTAMSVSRCCSVAQTLRASRKPQRRTTLKWVSLGIWIAAALVSLPPTIYSRTVDLNGADLCIQKFPGGEYSLALYHIQKVTVAFICPLIIISVSYLLILNFLRRHNLRSNNPRRHSKVTRSITTLVLFFFLCWLPNHAITFWGVLVKLDMAPWDTSYYIVHSYIHPLSILLANTNSCLNPIIYCLVTRQFRKSLKTLLRRVCSGTHPWLSPAAACRADPSEDSQVAIPLNQMDAQPVSRARERKGDTLPGTSTSVVQRN
ncbi:relaxin-3 receptor 1-like [Pristis pectinata]|uniref:relaxin-3 receptor 1-like n=1 Tax=Pristis pectinata TaxID=685728 RepID=UPI00223CEF98|nr:relaxin-3 receptor 1-like [Pristis pectinata]